MTVYFNFLGQYSEANFAKAKKDKDEYMDVDFKGKGGVGKARLKLPSVKQDMAVVGGLSGGLGLLSQANKGWKAKLAGAAIGGTAGAGGAYLLRKRAKDIDGRSDKGKRRK